MRRLDIRTFLAASLLMLCPTSVTLAQDRAPQVLAQAREALGAKGTVSVDSLAVKATIRRVITSMNMEMAAEVQLEYLQPDKYRRTETISIGAMTRETTVGVNGDQFFFDDGGLSAAMGMDPAVPGPQRIQAIKSLRHDVARLLTVWLLSPPDGQAYSFTYVGVAEAPDGKADVLDVKGPDDFNLRLYFDTNAHRLLMATHQTQTVALDKQQLQAMQDDVKRKAQENPQKAAELVREMREAMEKLPKKSVTIEMHVSDYRTVGGLSIPHQMTVSTEAQGQEEWTITSFKVNAALKPERFDKKK